MKPAFSKALVCGILASSFFIINCQKAPGRGVKPDTANPNGKQTAAQLPLCNDAAKAAIDARMNLYKEIKDIADAQPQNAPSTLSDDDKVKLDEKINLLPEKTADAVQKIRASVPASSPVIDGCEYKGATPADTKNVKTAELIENDRTLAAQVSRITGRSNAILDRDARLLVQDKKIKLSAELAEMLSSEANYNGEKAISEGHIISKADYETAKADLNKTSCIIKTADKQSVAADSEAKVVGTPAVRREAGSERDMAIFNIAIKSDAGDRAVAFDCNLAKNKDMSEEITKAFGDLVSPLSATPPAGEQPPPPAGEQPPPPAGEQPPPPAGEQPPPPAGEQPPPPATTGGEQPPGTPAPTPQVSAQQLQEAEALNALVQRMGTGH